MSEKFSIVFVGKAKEVLPRMMYLLSTQKNVTLVDIQRLSEKEKNARKGE